MYTSTLIVSKDAPQLIKLFASEEKDFGRSNYSIKKINSKVQFTINAQDATALKIAQNTIVKTLQVWEKTSNLNSNDN